MNTKYFLFVLLGAFLMFIVLKILSGNKSVKSETAAKFSALARTGEAMNLVRTNEFRELAKTTEFRELVKEMASEQINALAQTLTGSVKTF